MKSFVLLIAAVAVATAYYAGVNEAGLEFGNSATDTYQRPYDASIQYFKNNGANIIRLPFRWDRLMSNAGGTSLDNNYLNLIKASVSKATGLGLTVILDLHNYARFGGNVGKFPDFDFDTGCVGKAGGPTLAQFQNVWNLIAAVTDFNSKSNIWFSLMNEPAGWHDTSIPKDTGGCKCWSQMIKGSFTPLDAIRLNNAGIAGVRAAGATNKILVSGTVWTGVHSWFDSTWYSLQYPNAEGVSTTFPNGVLSNAQAFEPSTGLTGIKDSQNNWALEVHTYLDSGQAGTEGDCTNYNTDWLTRLSTWANGGAVDLSGLATNAQYGSATPANSARKIDLFLGEFGFQDDSAGANLCGVQAAKVFGHLKDNKIENGGRWLGFTFWAAGPMWDGSNTGYKYLVEPQWYFTDTSNTGKCNPDVNQCSFRERTLFTNFVKPQFVGATSSGGNTGNTGNSGTCVNSYTPTAGSKSGQTQYGPVGAGVQCGDQGNWGSNQLCCQSGYTCTWVNNNWSECRAGSGTPTTGAAATTGGSSGTCAAAWAQCGGTGWTGASTCCAGAGVCTYGTQYYYQCKPSKKRFSF